MKNFLKSFYINLKAYYSLGFFVVLFILGNFFSLIFVAAKIGLLLWLSVFIVDFLLIYFGSGLKVQARRIAPEKLSNGDENPITVEITNHYPFSVDFEIVDEIPFQFQIRNFNMKLRLKAGEKKTKTYILRPVERGEYNFGSLNVYQSSPLGIIMYRAFFNQNQIVPVYPSFLSLRKYELLAISNRLTEAGVKKIRKITNNNEFEQIRDYVQGDDFRTLNWKATARRQHLMVNQYQDEKSQQVFSIIDMGRTMKMPFREMSLLDYAINASLVISNIAIQKHDKAGLITFSVDIHNFVQADRKKTQMSKIMEVLYKQKTGFRESNMEALYAAIKRKISQRSLLLIYTNFEGYISLQRQLPYFKRLAKNHLLTVIFFENTEISDLLKIRADDIEAVYQKTIAEKYLFEKRLIKQELNKYGIHAILTKPENLTVNTINKYLEFKSKGMI